VGGKDANPEHQGSILEPLVHAKGDDNGLKGQYAESRLSRTDLRHGKGDDKSLKGKFAESRLSKTNLRQAKEEDNGLKGQQDEDSRLLRTNFRPLVHAFDNDNCRRDSALIEDF
jgi:hypothetical protein